MTGTTTETASSPRRLGPPQAARILGVSYWAIWSRISNGTIGRDLAELGDNGRYTIRETDLPKIAQKLGLTHAQTAA